MGYTGKRVMKKERNPKLLLLVMCSLLIVSLSATVTLARYTPQEEIALPEMSIQPLASIDGSANAIFTYDENGGQSMSFVLENSGSTERDYKLELFASLDFGDSAWITLTWDDAEYIGIPQPLTEEDEFFYTMGGGYLYRFYDADAQGEKIFTLSAGDENQLDLNITNSNSGLIQLQIIT